MAWYDNDETVRVWLKTKYSYEPRTGTITDRVKDASVGGINKKTGYLFVMLYEPLISLRATAYGHRLAWFLHHGEWPERDLDHENNNRADNRIENLRLATPIENARNRGKQNRSRRGKCHSNFKGVSWHKRDQCWVAYIQVEGKRIHLGEFLEEAKAAEAYKAAAELHFGNFAFQASAAASTTST